MKTKLFLCLCLISLSSSWAAPSRKNCHYYKQVEKEYRCGPEGYPLMFGHRLCFKYLQTEKKLSKDIQKWFPKIRYCLQNFIEKQHGAIRDCQDLKRQALDSHIGCYKRTGFCELSFQDRLSILQVTSSDLLNMDVVGLSMRVTAECKNIGL